MLGVGNYMTNINKLDNKMHGLQMTLLQTQCPWTQGGNKRTRAQGEYQKVVEAERNCCERNPQRSAAEGEAGSRRCT